MKKIFLVITVLLLAVAAKAVVVISEEYSFQAPVTVSELSSTDLIADRLVVTDSSGNFVSSSATTLEGSYLSGVSSSIQTQLNGKQASGNYITSITGDGTASGPGAAALTLATVNSNVGTFGDSANIPQFTVNAKGLVTAASNVSVSIPTQYTDEMAQDAVGGILSNGSDIHLTYSDGTPSISSTLTLTGVTNGSYGAADTVGTFTVDLKGRLTAAANAAIAILSSAVTDFTEAAQDSIGAMVDGSLVYTDSGPTLSRAALTGDVTASQGSNSTTLATVNSDVGTFGSATQVAQVTVNGKGLTTAASNVSIAIPSTQVTDFTEAAQDAVGAMVDSTLVYTDGTPLLSRAALTGDITASSGSNATTLATVNSNVGSFGSATQVGTFTVNGKGLITAASNATVTPAVGSITGLGTGVATWLATPSSANLASAITDETGSGALCFANTPTLVTPVIGAATGTSLVLTGALTSNALTSGRVTFAGTSGILQDDADMTFATDTLTVANVVGSSEVRMGNGLVNNPSLAFDSDTDTGWYRAGANQLGLSAAGAQSALFEELSVSSGSAQGWRLRNVSATASIPTLVPNQSDTNTGIGWASADELALVAGGTQIAEFNTSFSWIANDVGINTSTPAEVLDVNGNTIIRGTMVVDVGASSSAARVGADTGTYAALQFNGANNTSKDFIYQTAGSPRFTIRVSGNETGSDAGANLNFVPFNDSGSGLTTAMQIRRSNGNVGIGVTGASAKLQVNGQVGIVDGMSAPSTLSGYGQIYIDSADGDLKIKFGDGTVKTIVTD